MWLECKSLWVDIDFVAVGMDSTFAELALGDMDNKFGNFAEDKGNIVEFVLVDTGNIAEFAAVGMGKLPFAVVDMHLKH